MNKQNWLIVSCCWVLALGAGLALARLNTRAAPDPGAAETLRNPARGSAGSAESPAGTITQAAGASVTADDPGGSAVMKAGSADRPGENLEPLTVEDLLEMDRQRRRGYSMFNRSLETQNIMRRVTPEQALELIPKYLDAYKKEGRGHYPSALSSLFAVLAHGENPETALNLAQNLDNSQYGNMAIYSVVNAWSHDETTFQQLLNQVENREIQTNLMNQHLMRSDDLDASLDKMLRDLQDTPGETVKHRVRALLGQLALNDPEKALERLSELDNDWIAQEAAENIAQNMAWNDVDEGLELVEQITNPIIRSKMLSSMVSAISHRDPEKAAEIFEKMLMNPAASNRSWNIAHQLAEKDPAKARAWVDGLPAGEIQRNALQNVAALAVKKEPMETWEWLEKLPEGEMRKSAKSSALGGMMENDPDLALTLFGQLTDPEEKKDALRDMMSRWASDDPKAAREYAARIPDDELRGEAVERIAGRMGYDRPQEAAEWITRLPAKDQVKGVDSLVRSWAHRDVESAAAWVEKLSTGPARDVGLERIAGQVQRNDPQGAIMWVAGISDEETRRKELTNYAQRWIRKDETAARSWISNSDLPQETKDHLLKED